MNINFRAGYGNYQLNKKSQQVQTEDTQITGDNVVHDTIDVSTTKGMTFTTTDENGNKFEIILQSTCKALATGPSDNLISSQAAELLKMNTMNFRQI